MDTINSRRKIGFPKEKKEWAESPAQFDQHTLKIAGHPVMEDWELPYMELLAKIATSNGGTILELGYGLGLSASSIQSHDIKEHFVVECHPDVIASCLKQHRSAINSNRLHILSGFWEQITPTLKDGLFDGILFDTYPLNEEQIHSNHFWFFHEAFRLLKTGGIFTYYSDEATDFSPTHLRKLHEAGFKPEDIDFEICPVQPPKDCEYWNQSSFIAPIIRKF